MSVLTLCADGFWISPYVFSCYVALHEKGLRFAVKDVRLDASEQRTAHYKASTWTGRVPALVDGDFILTESSAILEYLEDAYAAPHARIYPADARSRARARQLMSWLRSDETLPLRAERSAEVIFYTRPRPPLTASALMAVDKLTALATRLVTVAEAPLFGEWCIADAELAFFLKRLTGDDAMLPDVLRGYAETQWARPSVAEFVAHERAPFVPYG